MGGFMFARGVGREHWDEVMKNQKTHIQKWHKLQVSIDNLSVDYVLAVQWPSQNYVTISLITCTV